MVDLGVFPTIHTSIPIGEFEQLTLLGVSFIRIDVGHTPQQADRLEALLPHIHHHLPSEREFVIDDLLVQTQFITVVIRWTGLAP